MSAINANATATDTLGLSASDSEAFSVVASVPPRTVDRDMQLHRINYSSLVNVAVDGPTIGLPDSPVWIGQVFNVFWGCTLDYVRIFKHPFLNGSIPVVIWQINRVTGRDWTIIGQTTWTCVSDNGGWRKITLPSTPLSVGFEYAIGYYSSSLDPLGGGGTHSYYCFSRTIWEAQDWENLPFDILSASATDANGNPVGGAVAQYSSDPNPANATMPSSRSDFNYYISPHVYWTDPRPYYSDPTSFRAQWTDIPSYSSFAFPVSVFFADPQDLASYFDNGVNTLVAGGVEGYTDSIIAAGMDHWPTADPGDDPTLSAIITAVTDPDYGPHVRGYYVADEPDLTLVNNQYRSPTVLQGWISTLKKIDSTRPYMLGLSNLIGLNGAFYGYPSNLNMAQNAIDWRAFANSVDVLGGDFYTLHPDEIPSITSSKMGVWMYYEFTQRLREVCDDRIPVAPVVETTDISGVTKGISSAMAQITNSAIWGTLIGGARGIHIFDHYFGAQGQDDAAMIHNSDPSMRNMIKSLSAFCQTIARALLTQDLGLVSAAVTDNLFAGPVGGIYGVPLIYTTRFDSGASHHYLFVMANRPSVSSVTLSNPLSTGAPITSLPISQFMLPIPSGASINLIGPSSQNWVSSAPTVPGATSIPVNSQTPNFAYGAGTTGTLSKAVTGTLTLPTLAGQTITRLDPVTGASAGAITLDGSGTFSDNFGGGSNPDYKVNIYRW